MSYRIEAASKEEWAERAINAEKKLAVLIRSKLNTFTMFNAVKEIIWHLTCASCKGWFTFATMEEKYCIERTTFHCPHCGKKGRADTLEVDTTK
jgi:hypothetical protein